MAHLPIVPKVYVDWDDDGSFADANSDISADVRAVSWQRGRASVNEEFGAGSATVEVLNTAGTYSPFNTGSAIYAQMLPGRVAKIEATHNAITYPVFYGRVADVSQGRAPNDAPIIRLSLQDDFARMSRSRYRTPASMLSGGLVSAILASILTDFGIAGGMQDLDTAVQSVDSFWQHNGSHLEAAKSIVHQELGGAYYIARDGKHTFENRQATSSAVVHATFTGVQSFAMDLRESDWIDEVVHKRAGLDVDPATAAIYNLFPTGRELAPGSTDAKNTFHGDYIASARNVVQPVPGLDYTANTQADGLGADVTNQVSVTAWTSYGGGFEITMNNASGAAAYLTEFVVRGQAIRQSDTTREIAVSDATAPVTNQALRDEFAFNDDVDALLGYAQFRLFAGSTFYPRNLGIHLTPRTDAEAVSMLGVELLKRLRITNTTGLYPSTIDEEFIVQGISGRWVPGGGIEMDLNLWHEIAAVATFFRISGASGGGQDYSQIVAAGATTGDRIRY